MLIQVKKNNEKFFIEPDHLFLGGRGANRTDVLKFELPEEWQNKTVKATFSTNDGEQYAFLLDSSKEVAINKDFMKDGLLTLDATDGVYQAYTTDARYYVYDHADVGDFVPVTTSEEEQWIGMLHGTLDDVYVPESITELRDYVFYDYTKIKHITLNHVHKIGNWAFAGCVSLSSTSLSNELYEIGNSAFMNTGFHEIHLPAGLVTIHPNAFSRCRYLKKATFLGTPKEVANNIFTNCASLTEINVPWSEGEVDGAPWGATKAVINYNYAG